jgi:hypothetical protein
LINAEILLQQGDRLQLGKVNRRSVDDSGNIIGTYSENPIMNSIVYEVEFPDGELKEYAANILAENMLSQVDDEGHNILLMRDIIVREGVAKDEWRTSYVNTHDNEADLLTKMLPAVEKRSRFVRNLLHHIYRS